MVVYLNYFVDQIFKTLIIQFKLSLRWMCKYCQMGYKNVCFGTQT